MTRFSIMHAPRVGSTMLGTMLNRHPAILCHNEIFNVEVIGYAHTLLKPAGTEQAAGDKLVMGYGQSARPLGFDLGDIDERNRDPGAFLTKVWAMDLGHQILGLQMCWRQNEVAFEALMADREVKKILLNRRNRVKLFVSWQIALKTRQWWVYRPETLLHEKPKVEVTREALDKYSQFNSDYYRGLEQRLTTEEQSYQSLYYEDLFDQRTQDDILQFLGLGSSRKLLPDTVKQNPSDLRLSIANYDELAAALRGSEYEAELLSEEY